MISFVGAGPGAPDLITLRGARRLGSADIVVWASSLVPEGVLEHARSGATLHDSAGMTLEDVLAVYADNPEAAIVRLHSGDPALYGAIQEQIDWCLAQGRDFEIVPGVSSLGAAAAAAGRELTIPTLAQSVILTRLAGRTAASVPDSESIRAFASHGTTMAVFLSASRPHELQRELLAPGSGYDISTPAVIVVRASWPDEAVIPTTLGRLAEDLRAAGARTTVLVLVGPALGESEAPRSHLYSPSYAHLHRRRSAPGSTAGRPTGRNSAGATGREKGLRKGWTTGTCASAAAKAAAIGLTSGSTPEEVEVGLPDGTRVTFPVVVPEPGASAGRASTQAGTSTAVVVKDAGDDPDCTDGARLTATVARAPSDRSETCLLAGPGVGTITLPGLGLPVGAPAINPVPRRMILAALAEVTTEPLVVTFAVPGGEEMATKTTNARLGIAGGISILGTTGVVRPFSTAAYRASVVQQIDVAAAQGEKTVVLATGSRSEQAAMRLHPDLPEVCFVEVGDFTGIALRRAVRAGISRVELVAMAGKIAKLAAGVMMTHFHRSKVDNSLMAEAAAATSAPPAVLQAATATATARHFFETCAETGFTAPLEVLCDRARQACESHVGDALSIRVRMVDFDGDAVVATSG